MEQKTETETTVRHLVLGCTFVVKITKNHDLAWILEDLMEAVEKLQEVGEVTVHNITTNPESANVKIEMCSPIERIEDLKFVLDAFNEAGDSFPLDSSIDEYFDFIDLKVPTIEIDGGKLEIDAAALVETEGTKRASKQAKGKLQKGIKN